MSAIKRKFIRSRSNTTLKEVEYDEGITVLDISNPGKVKYCFAVLPGQFGVT